MTPLRLAVVGAGVSGLSAARELDRASREDRVPCRITVFEAEGRVGGRVLSAEVRGQRVDVGAESMLVRDPSTIEVLSALGLDGELVRPGTTSASIWSGRRLVPIPKGTSLGVPLHPLQPGVVRLLGPLGSLRAFLEPWLLGPTVTPDDPLGPFLEGRLGKAAVRRLVDPLLGGVYAGPAELLSVGAVAPHLLSALERDRSLLRGLRQQPAAPPGAVTGFIALRSGLQTLAEKLAGGLDRSALRLQTPVRGAWPAPLGQMRVETGQGSEEFDGLVLALPAPPAAELLQGLAPELARELRRQRYSNVATITLAYPESAISRRPPGSGFLVPRFPGRVVTACTFMDQKWPHLRQPGILLLRASAGGHGDDWPLEVDDATLVTSVHTHLRRHLGLRQVPLEARVQRWSPALPQYRAGHLAWRDSVEAQVAALPYPVVLAGAAYRGVGLEACLRDGVRAARALWQRLGGAATMESRGQASDVHP
ncbi:MAG: protoporphyrinogen oxidase [Candidatus Dormibacteraeota bacterium]|nr:protoporphyrinogen oxidase [Candidatus Dormibacteraeota bacterium]